MASHVVRLRQTNILSVKVDVAISNGIEGGLGAILGRRPAIFALETSRHLAAGAFCDQKRSVLAPRPRRPSGAGVGTVRGNTFNNVIEKRLAAAECDDARTDGRCGAPMGCSVRLTGNLWDEFWPDVRKRLSR